MLVAALVLALIDAFRSAYNDSLGGLLALGAFVVVCALAWVPGRHCGGLARAGLALLPLLAAMPGLLAIHFIHTLPLLPEGAASIALGALALATAWLGLCATRDAELSPEQIRFSQAQRFVRRQLRRDQPGLEDAWLLHIIALGCRPDLDRWRAKHRGQPLGPFTGSAILDLEAEFADQLDIPSAKDALEFDEE